MSFSDNFIKKPVLTTVCSILIVLVGLIAIPTLPIANLPNIADPLIQVSAVYGGANAEVTEQAVTNPIEQQINGVPGVAYIASTSDMTGGIHWKNEPRTTLRKAGTDNLNSSGFLPFQCRFLPFRSLGGVIQAKFLPGGGGHLMRINGI